NMIRSNIQTHGVTKISHQKVDFKTVTWTGKGLIDSTKYEEIMANKVNAYKSRLKVLADLCAGRHIKPIFITQPSRMFKGNGKNVTGTSEVFELDGLSYNGKDFYYMFNLFNKGAVD